MPRIFKFSKFALKLYVPNASHMEQMKILLYTDSYDIAVEYTKGFTINNNEVKVIVSNNDFNNMNDGVIKYRVEGYIDNNYYVEERQSNYYLKTPSDYTSSDLTGIKEIFQDNGEGIMIINAVDYGVDGFSSVEIDANEYGQTKYSDGYYAGETEQKAKLEPIEITKNGTYSREDGYNQIHVNIEGKGPVETTYKFIGNNGYFENTSEVIEIDNNYVKAISLKNDGELTTSFCPLSDGYLYYISSTQHGEFYVKIENGKLYVKISEREGSCDIELNKWHLFVLNFDYFTLDGNTIQLSEGSVPTSISTTWYMGGKYLSTTGEFTEPLHFEWEYSIMNYTTYYHYRYIYLPYQEGKIIRYYTRDSELVRTETYDFVNGPIESFKRGVDGFSPVEVCTSVDLASISVQPDFSNLEVTIDNTYYEPYDGIDTLSINNKELANEVYNRGIESNQKSFKSGELTISENGEYINSDVEEFYSIWMLETTPYDGVWLLDDVMRQRIECRFRYTHEMLQGNIPWIFGKTDETNGFSNKNKFGLEVNGNDTEAWCNYWQNGKKQKIVFNYGEWIDFVSYPHPDYANKRVIECAGQYFEIDNPSMLNDNGRLKYCGVGALLSTDDNKEGQYIKNTKYLGELAYLRVTSNNVNVSYEPEYYPGVDDVVLILRGSRWGARIITNTPSKYIRKSKITNTWEKVIVDVPQTGGSGGDCEEAYEQGKADQKALLTSTTINRNGTYTRENGYNEVVVNVPSTLYPKFFGVLSDTIGINYHNIYNYMGSEGEIWAGQLWGYVEQNQDKTSNGMMYEFDYYSGIDRAPIANIYMGNNYNLDILNLSSTIDYNFNSWGLPVWGKKSLVTPWVYNVNNSPTTTKILPDCILGGFECGEVEYINRVFEGAEKLRVFQWLHNLGKSFTSVNTLDLSVLTKLNDDIYGLDSFIEMANSVYNFAVDGMNVNGISYSNVKLPGNASQEQVEAWTNVGWVVGF